MKYIIVFISLFAAGFNLFAQKTSDKTWSGEIIDFETGEKIVNAVVEIHDTEEKKIAYGGLFTFYLKGGVYHVHARALGYEPGSKTVNLIQDVVGDKIFLRPTSFELPLFMLESEYLKSEHTKNSQDIEQIDKEELLRRNEGSFAESLERIPGMSSIQVGVGIAKPVIRGMSFNRIIVNEGGVKQEGQQWAADHGLELDQYNMERVEIIKGPASVLFGSDGMGGVINVLPPKIPEKNSVSLDFLGSYKRNNDFFGGSAGFKMNKNNFFVIARSTHKNFGDFRVPAEEFVYNNFVLPIYDRRLKNTAGKEFNNYLSLGKIARWGTFRVNYSRYEQFAGFFAGATGRPQFFDLRHFDQYRNIELPYQHILHHKATFNINANIGKNWLRIDGGFQNNIRREYSAMDAHAFRPITGDTLANLLDLKTYTLNARYYQNLRKELRLIYGYSGSYMANDIGGFEFIIPEYNSFQQGVFGFTEWTIDSVKTFSGGIRFDHAQHQVVSYVENLYNSQLELLGEWERTPSFVRNFYNFSATSGIAFDLNHHLNLKFNIARAYRIPTVPELGANGVHHGTFRHEQGNTELSSERGTQLDAFMMYHNKNFILKISPFFSFYENYIFLRPQAQFSPLPDAGQLYRYEEAPVIHSGGEARIEYHPFSFLHLKWDAAYVNSYNLNSGRFLPFIPPFNTSFAVEGEWVREGLISDLFLELEFRYYAPQNLTDINELQTPQAFLLNANTGFTLGGSLLPLQVLLGVRNMLNTPYFNHLSRYRLLNIPEPGFNFMVTLRVPLHFHLAKD